MAALGADLTDSDMDDTFFAGGSMFWFRRSALAGLADPRLWGLFEPEVGQLDATAAHATERLFPVEARRQGYISLAVPALMSSRPDMPMPELLELARRHADVPSRYFPAPNVPALPLTPVPTPPPARLGPMALLAALYRASLPVGLRLRLRRLMRR
jgi:lipopolysaccharide biosynthesis protein